MSNYRNRRTSENKERAACSEPNFLRLAAGCCVFLQSANGGSAKAPTGCSASPRIIIFFGFSAAGFQQNLIDNKEFHYFRGWVTNITLRNQWIPD